MYRARVSTGATGAAAPELFEGHKAKKKFFREISKKFISKKNFRTGTFKILTRALIMYIRNPNPKFKN